MQKIYIKLLISILLCLTVGFLSGMATAESVRTWYMTLEKPSFNPPSWLFAPVWTTLYILMGISVAYVWQEGIHLRKVKTALTAFTISLLLNGLWSILFFGMQKPLWAFVEIVLLWVSIVVFMRLFHQIKSWTAFLQIPYLLWVSFAAVLNFTLWYLNS